MTKETFEKIYIQFIEGTALVNRISIYNDSIGIFDKVSSLLIYYKDIESISVNRHYYGCDNEYAVILDITLLNDCKYSMEITSNL